MGGNERFPDLGPSVYKANGSIDIYKSEVVMVVRPIISDCQELKHHFETRSRSHSMGSGVIIRLVCVCVCFLLEAI